MNGTLADAGGAAIHWASRLWRSTFLARSLPLPRRECSKSERKLAHSSGDYELGAA